MVGTNWSNGGFKIETGIDQDINGQLSAIEIILTRFVCNGDNDRNSLINITTEPAGIVQMVVLRKKMD
jgi:hypothetical protein